MKGSRVLSGIRVHLIALLASALPLGIVAAVVVWDLTTGVPGGAILRVGFAAVVAAAALTGRRDRVGWIWPWQRIALRLDPDADVDEVRSRAVQALGEVSPRPVDPDRRGRLVVRTPTSMRSFGETVRVEVRAAGAETDVVISSRPLVPVAVIDFGKGRANVQAVERALRS